MSCPIKGWSADILFRFEIWYRRWDSNPQCIFVQDFKSRVYHQFHHYGILKAGGVAGFESTNHIEIEQSTIWMTSIQKIPGSEPGVSITKA